MTFLDVYRSWVREQRQHCNVELTDVDLDAGPDHDLNIDPLDLMIRREVLQEAFPEDTLTRKIIFLSANGYTQAEIAEIIGVTAKAVEGKLYRFRGKSRPGGGSR